MATPAAARNAGPISVSQPTLRVATPVAPPPASPVAAVRAALRQLPVIPVTAAPQASVAAAAEPAAPLATATTTPGSVGSAGVDLVALLAGGGGGSPAAAPLQWAALAVSRREIGAVARTTVAASSVSTGEPLNASAVAATQGAVVQSISLPRPGTYGTGTTMTFVLNFDQAVDVKNTNVYLPVQVGFAMDQAQYVSGSGTRRLVFELTVPANNYGDVAVGRVSNQLLQGATTPVRIFDFNGQGNQAANESASDPKIVNAGTNTAVSETMPTLNTSAITVDARGPAVVSYGNNGAITTINGPLGLLHWTVLTVNFDSPVRVQGAPSVPVTIGGTPDVLTYASGSGTSTLTFAKLSIGAAPGAADFPDTGQVINLPTGANITDRLGNSIAVALDNFGVEPGTLGPPLVENGNRLVVLGTHYQYLGTVTKSQLNDVLTTEANGFYSALDAYTGQDPAPYWAAYEPKNFATSNYFVSANYDVKLYRVAYNSTIPEQNDRPTLAYGLAAIPQGVTGPLSLMSYQHGTLVGKGEVPSQSFNWMLDPQGPPDEFTNPAYALYKAAYETRLNVAQFGGQGYAVIAADYFGVGNSLENDGYISKASQQQACLDMYTASIKLLAEQNHSVSNFFIGGWSQGGLVTVDFLEKLQSVGIPVTKAATASAPANVALTANAWYFNPRVYPYALPNTPDAVWLNVVAELSNFSITGYAGYDESPLQLLGTNYEAARALYMREYLFDPAKFWGPDYTTGINVIRPGLATVVFPYSLQQDIATPYSAGQCTTTCKTPSNAIAFAQTDYGQLLATSGAGQVYLNAPVAMYYGQEDEVIPLVAGTAVYNWQKSSFNKQDIWALQVAAANHRGTFLASVRGELDWFNGGSVPTIVLPTGTIATSSAQ